MLNRIIRLQALLEIITNQTSSALELLSTQQTQTRAAVYQNRLALDYLLAEEGGVCGKFNTSDCCLHIDDNGEAVKKIAQNIRKLAHVPVQTWHSITTADWWNNLFQPGWWKKALVIVGLSLASFLFLPCLIPCFIKLITSVVTTMPLIQDLQMNKPPQQLPQKMLALKETKKEKRNRKRSQLVYDKFHKQTSLQEEVSTPV